MKVCEDLFDSVFRLRGIRGSAGDAALVFVVLIVSRSVCGRVEPYWRAEKHNVKP